MLSNTPRVGYPCKIFSENTRKDEYALSNHLKTFSAAWTKRNGEEVVRRKLVDTVIHNMKALKNLIRHTKYNTPCSMVRFGSDVLPMYTHPDVKPHYDETIRRFASDELKQVGRLAADLDIRLSFHPGQFCCLASDRPDVIDRSVEEFEYHAQMAEMINQGAGSVVMSKVNVHLSGRGGADMFREVFNKRLSHAAKSVITIENDEVGSGLDDVLQIADLCPIVFDLHHQWVNSGGEYIDHNDSRFDIIRESWHKRGARPTIHYSYPRVIETTCPDYQGLIESDELQHMNIGKNKLRAHSDAFPNREVNEYAKKFIEWSDIMCEAKFKDVAALQFITD